MDKKSLCKVGIIMIGWEQDISWVSKWRIYTRLELHYPNLCFLSLDFFGAILRIFVCNCSSLTFFRVETRFRGSCASLYSLGLKYVFYVKVESRYFQSNWGVFEIALAELCAWPSLHCPRLTHDCEFAKKPVLYTAAIQELSGCSQTRTEVSPPSDTVWLRLIGDIFVLSTECEWHKVPC